MQIKTQIIEQLVGFIFSKEDIEHLTYVCDMIKHIKAFVDEHRCELKNPSVDHMDSDIDLLLQYVIDSTYILDGYRDDQWDIFYNLMREFTCRVQTAYSSKSNQERNFI